MSTSYTEFCRKAANNLKVFKSFRRSPTYNFVLEHVTKKQGESYLRIISAYPELLNVLDKFRENDRVGNPVTYNYAGIGKISPTTLRYVKVLADLRKHFSSLDNLNIIEIGVGYGGQCRIINSYYKPKSYRLVDIQPALDLAKRYLDNYVIDSVLDFRTMNELDFIDYDLVISNYAISQLSKKVQNMYFNKVILNSERGYITYNDIGLRKYNSFSSEEYQELIPEAKRVNEEPLTSKNNCIIFWGDINANHA